MRHRIVFVFLVFALIWIGIILRAVYLQVLPNENLSRLRAKQFETVVKLEPRRGDIVDRNGKELAASIGAYSLFADPKIIKTPKRLSKKLANLLDIPQKELFLKLKQEGRRFVWIERRLDSKIKKTIESWKEPGLGFVEEGKRVYPQESLLAQSLGFLGREGNGLGGLESRYEKELKGEFRKFNVRRDAYGRPLVADGQVFTEQPGGASLQLTIDSELQYFLEQELREARDRHEAIKSIGIVLDAQTSEVLAIASEPGFDANLANKASIDELRNSAIMDAFEPGSTLKTFTIAAALRDGIVQPNTKYYCEKGKMKIADRWIREADTKHNWEWLTVSQILEVSSNIGVTKIANDLSQEKLRQAFLDFGLGEKTGIDLPGETRGIIPPLPWRPHHFSNISFGHGISLSPLQIANAYAMIANGGVLRPPRIVKGFIQPETKEFLATTNGSERRVLSEADAATMRIMLTGVTSALGTGSRARIPGFIVAGKTGTAQKVNPDGRGYLKGSYISSFVGFVPANNPKFVIYIAVDSSKKGYYGSDVAAPVFNRVAEYALRTWGIQPTVINEKDILTKTKHKNYEPITTQTETPNTVPNLKGLTVREVLERVQGQDIKLELKGKGVVINTLPAAGEPFLDEKKLKVELGRTTSQ